MTDDERIDAILQTLPTASGADLADALRFCKRRLRRDRQEMWVARGIFWAFVGGQIGIVLALAIGAGMLIERLFPRSGSEFVMLGGLLTFFGLMRLMETHDGLNDTGSRLRADAEGWGEKVAALDGVVRLVESSLLKVRSGGSGVAA